MKKRNQSGRILSITTLYLSFMAGLLFMTFSCSNSADKVNTQGASDSQETVKRDTVIDKMPEFPGGEAAMTKFIIDNVRYPEAAKKSGTQGKVLVDFLVTKTGKIDSVRVKEKGNVHLDNEAIRVVASMPDWIPGKHQGRVVDVMITLPVSFKLE